MLFDDREQTPREPETPFEVFYTLAFLLHYYTTELSMLFVSFLIDIALLVAALCSQLGEGIVDVVEVCLPPADLVETCTGEAEQQAIRLPVPLLWVCGSVYLLAGTVLWVCASRGIFSTPQALAAAVLAIALLPAHLHAAEVLTDLVLTDLWRFFYEVEAARLASSGEEDEAGSRLVED